MNLLYIVPREVTLEEIEITKEARRGWENYKAVLTAIGIVPSWEIELAYYAGYARES